MGLRFRSVEKCNISGTNNNATFGLCDKYA